MLFYTSFALSHLGIIFHPLRVSLPRFILQFSVYNNFCFATISRVIIAIDSHLHRYWFILMFFFGMSRLRTTTKDHCLAYCGLRCLPNNLALSHNGCAVSLSPSFNLLSPVLKPLLSLLFFCEMFDLWCTFSYFYYCMYLITSVGHNILIFLFFQYMRSWLANLTRFIIEIHSYISI